MQQGQQIQVCQQRAGGKLLATGRCGFPTGSSSWFGAWRMCAGYARLVCARIICGGARNSVRCDSCDPSLYVVPVLSCRATLPFGGSLCGCPVPGRCGWARLDDQDGGNSVMPHLFSHAHRVCCAGHLSMFQVSFGGMSASRRGASVAGCYKPTCGNNSRWGCGWQSACFVFCAVCLGGCRLVDENLRKTTGENMVEVVDSLAGM